MPLAGVPMAHVSQHGRVVQTDAALVLIVAGEIHAIVNKPDFPGNLMAAIAQAIFARPVRAS